MAPVPDPGCYWAGAEAARRFWARLHHPMAGGLWGKASKCEGFSSLIYKKRELKEMISRIPSGPKQVLILGHFRFIGWRWVLTGSLQGRNEVWAVPWQFGSRVPGVLWARKWWNRYLTDKWERNTLRRLDWHPGSSICLALQTPRTNGKTPSAVSGTL